MYSRINKKIFQTVILIILIFVILSVVGIFLLRYQVDGETNIPFKISKISIIQSVEGIENKETNTWSFDVNQNNDIYIYIEKNENYGKTEVIENININNIKIQKQKESGMAKLYKPVQDEKKMFINNTENEIAEIKYLGELESNIKQQKISNQGGIVAFRYGINNLSQYISEQETEVDHSKLLKLTNIKEEDLKTHLLFDLTINLKGNKNFKTTIDLDIPSDEIIEKGTVGIELTDLNNIVFKRT